MEDLSPEGINRTHGRPVWRCWGCKAETGLHWHNGWSVAMCRNPECAKAYDAMCADQVASEEAYLAHVREHYGEYP
jgi:hypothetical protein